MAAPSSHRPRVAFVFPNPRADLAAAQSTLATTEADLARVTAAADDMEMRVRIARDAQEAGRVRDQVMPVRKKDGSEITGLFSAEMLNFQDRHELLTVMLDITEQRRSQEALAELNRELGVTVLVSLHKVDYAFEFCPRTIALLPCHHDPAYP